MSPPPTYATATGPRLGDRDALRAVLEYAEDFIALGDLEVLDTLSGGSILSDGGTADPAVWSDWTAAWTRAASRAQREEPRGGQPALLSMQHGFRALHVFLDRYYEPVDETPMSVVRDDCRRALGNDVGAQHVWANWLQAVEAGATADIALRLEPEVSILREVWRRIARRRGSGGRRDG